MTTINNYSAVSNTTASAEACGVKIMLNLAVLASACSLSYRRLDLLMNSAAITAYGAEPSDANLMAHLSSIAEAYSADYYIADSDNDDGFSPVYVKISHDRNINNNNINNR